LGLFFLVRSREFKILELHSESASLREVISASPSWWTPTTKAKAIVGLVLALRFWHSLGLVQGRLTTNNIVFDSNHQIQITDLLCGLSSRDVYGFSSEGWNPKRDIRGFVSILFEIIVGRPLNDETYITADVPMFVSDMIEAGLSNEKRGLSSFRNIFEILKCHDFRIVPGVGSAEVLTFVDWVEQLEQSRE
jgi:hypothetical protein